MNLGKVEIWETSLDRIVTLREAQRASCAPCSWSKKNTIDGRLNAGIMISRTWLAKKRAHSAGLQEAAKPSKRS